MILALGQPSRLASTLHRRQQQGDENADDGDDHQQFYKGKPCASLKIPLTKHDYTPCSFIKSARHQVLSPPTVSQARACTGAVFLPLRLFVSQHSNGTKSRMAASVPEEGSGTDTIATLPAVVTDSPARR